MGKSVAQLLCVGKRLVLYFKYLLETEERCYCSRINVQVITISVYESNNSPRGKMLWHTVEFS